MTDVTKFAEKFNPDPTFLLLADADHSVAEKYGVWQEKSMYGKTYMGVGCVNHLRHRQGRQASANVLEKVKPGRARSGGIELADRERPIT